MTCNKCGRENFEFSKVCVGCGAALETVAAEDPVVTPETAVPTEETVPAVQVETVESTDFSAAPPVMEPQQVTAQTNPYYQPYQPPVQPPVQNTPYWQPPVMPQNNGEKPVSFGKWMGIMALEYFLNIVHLILMFVWGFSSDTEASLKNYARARLVWAAIGTVFAVLFFVLIFVFAGIGFVDLADEFMYY